MAKTWPEDQPAVLIFALENGDVVDALIVPPGNIELHDLDEISGLVVVHARVYRDLARPSLADCELHIGGGIGESLGEPALAWRSPPVELGAGDIVLAADASPEPFDVRVSGCDRPPASCDVLLTVVPAERSFYGLREVAAIDPDTAIAAGAQRAIDESRTFVLQIKNERSSTIDTELLGLASVVARHGLNAVLTSGANVVEVDTAGRTIHTTTVSAYVADGATGADGTTMLIAVDGTIYEIPPGEFEPQIFSEPDYAIRSGDEPRIAVWRRDRVLVSGPDGRLYFYDGVAWRHELPSTELFDALAIDGDAMLAVPNEDQLLLREGDGEWRALGPAFIANRAIAAASLGDGRFIVTGQSGSLVYWNGEQLCYPASATDRNLEDVDFYPGANAGFIVGENDDPDTPPLILRVEVPL